MCSRERQFFFPLAKLSGCQLQQRAFFVRSPEREFDCYEFLTAGVAYWRSPSGRLSKAFLDAGLAWGAGSPIREIVALPFRPQPAGEAVRIGSCPFNGDGGPVRVFSRPTANLYYQANVPLRGSSFGFGKYSVLQCSQR